MHFHQRPLLPFSRSASVQHAQNFYSLLVNLDLKFLKQANSTIVPSIHCNSPDCSFEKATLRPFPFLDSLNVGLRTGGGFVWDKKLAHSIQVVSIFSHGGFASLQRAVACVHSIKDDEWQPLKSCQLIYSNDQTIHPTIRSLMPFKQERDLLHVFQITPDGLLASTVQFSPDEQIMWIRPNLNQKDVLLIPDADLSGCAYERNCDFTFFDSVEVLPKNDVNRPQDLLIATSGPWFVAFNMTQLRLPSSKYLRTFGQHPALHYISAMLFIPYGLVYFKVVI